METPRKIQVLFHQRSRRPWLRYGYLLRLSSAMAFAWTLLFSARWEITRRKMWMARCGRDAPRLWGFMGGFTNPKIRISWGYNGIMWPTINMSWVSPKWKDRILKEGRWRWKIRFCWALYSDPCTSSVWHKEFDEKTQWTHFQRAAWSCNLKGLG